jgi:cyclase
MDADGTKEGYDIELTCAVASAVNIPVIASGGAGNLEHLRAALQEAKQMLLLPHLFSILANILSVKQNEFLAKTGVPVRL